MPPETLIRQFLEKAGIAHRLEVHTMGPQTLFEVHSDDSSLLQGEALHAINFLLKKLHEEKGDSASGKEKAHFLVDVGGYHKKRIEDLHRQADLLAERARLFRRDIEMDPMTPYDRMIVHAFLQESPDVRTESLGEGSFRRIVIRFGKEKESPTVQV